jgi:hypothetical protein
MAGGKSAFANGAAASRVVTKFAGRMALNG